MDSRDRYAMYGSDHEGFDAKTMTISYLVYDEEDEEELISFPAKFEVCNLCRGKGTHINPSIDHNGISTEEFDEDPEFRENYFSGMYDQTCYCCNGKRVEPVINEDAFTAKQIEDWKRVEEMLNNRAMDRQTEDIK